MKKLLFRVMFAPALLVPAVLTAAPQSQADVRASVEQIIPAETNLVQAAQVPRRATARTVTEQLSRTGASDAPQAVPQNLVDACQEAVRQNVRPPAGINCASVLEASPPAAAPPTAEEALLTMLRTGVVPRNITAATRVSSDNADSVAQQLSTEGGQSPASLEAAAAAIRQGQN